MIDRKRVIEALRSAAENATEKAAAIRAELAEIEEDGAPDGPPRRTKDYCYEDDAKEWDIDARILDDLRERMTGNWDADLSHAERATPPAHRSGGTR